MICYTHPMNGTAISPFVCPRESGHRLQAARRQGSAHHPGGAHRQCRLRRRPPRQGGSKSGRGDALQAEWNHGSYFRLCILLGCRGVFYSFGSPSRGGKDKYGFPRASALGMTYIVHPTHLHGHCEEGFIPDAAIRIPRSLFPAKR